MLPKGGDGLWGPGSDLCQSRSDDDPFCSPDKLSPFLVVTDPDNITVNASESAIPEESALRETVESFAKRKMQSVEDTINYLQAFGGSLGPDIAASRLHSFHGEEKPSSRTWHDPSRTPLPHAPSMKIFCMYGVGLPTERAYYYKINHAGESGNATADIGADPAFVLDTSVHQEVQNAKYGVRYSDGDGSVSLLSLGYICADGWKRPETGLNPSNLSVYTREYADVKQFQVDDPIRSGPGAADHIDILGNSLLKEDLLRIVTNFDPPNKDNIVSDIERIAEEINKHPNGGLPKVTRKKWPFY
jgi:phospholipid:diacylglycerol acyltransferase